MNKVMIIKDKSFLYKLYWYIRRKITNTGPHGKYCGCNKWGVYYGLGGCTTPTHKLNVIGSIQDKK